MSNLTLSFSRPWNIRQPIVTRYLDERFLDSFMNEGKLRLSSFKAFRRNPDEEKGDLREGFIDMQIQQPNGSHTIAALNGQEAYVLCASIVESQDIAKYFNTNCGFRILDTLKFADIVSHHIPGFVGGIQGMCFYRDCTYIRKNSSESIRNPDDFNKPDEYMKYIEDYTRRHIHDSFFVKHNRYAKQCEFRFVWFASGVERDFIDIVCKDAVNLCERVIV